MRLGIFAKNPRMMAKYAITTALMMVMAMPTFGAPLISNEENTSPTLTLLTDVSGIRDDAFNESALKGLTAFAKKSGSSLRVVEAKSMEDLGANLEAAAESNSKLTFAVGFLFNQALTEVAKKYPEHHFIVIDSVVEQDNVASVVFSEEEGSYLVGIAAGLATKSNKIGFVTGMDMPLINKFEIGFRAGVASVNPKAKVTNVIANSFSDSELGERIGKEMHQKGIDVVYTAAGNVSIGVAKSAVKYKYWFIGTDTDQSALAPRHTLCSMVKRIDVAAGKMAEIELKDKFKGGVYEFGLAQEGVGISDKAGRLSPATIKVIEQFKKAIVDGTIDVPSTHKDLIKFKTPKIKFQRPLVVVNK